MAQRLRLSFTRNHFVGLIDKVNKTQMAIREALVYIFARNHAARGPWYSFGSDGKAFSLESQPCDFAVNAATNRFAPGVWRELQSMEWLAARENLAVFGKAGTKKLSFCL